MINDEIVENLFRLQDKGYRDFFVPLIPTAARDTVIGVRTPALRKYAKELSIRPDRNDFLFSLPHRYFEENQLHAFLISELRDYALCMEKLREFLPFVDNWATCDQMSPKVFRKHHQDLLPEIRLWIRSEKTYAVRFGVKMLMEHFLDEDFSISYPELVAQIRSEEYYVNMMRAWYFATALAKQYDLTLPFLEEYRLDPWTHNKTIQKAVESYRISPEHKCCLKSLKISGRSCP